MTFKFVVIAVILLTAHTVILRATQRLFDFIVPDRLNYRLAAAIAGIIATAARSQSLRDAISDLRANCLAPRDENTREGPDADRIAAVIRLALEQTCLAVRCVSTAAVAGAWQRAGLIVQSWDAGRGRVVGIGAS